MVFFYAKLFILIVLSNIAINYSYILTNIYILLSIQPVLVFLIKNLILNKRQQQQKYFRQNFVIGVVISSKCEKDIEGFFNYLSAKTICMNQ